MMKLFMFALTAAAMAQTVDDAPLEAQWQQAKTEGRQAFEKGFYRQAEPLLSKALVLAQQLPEPGGRVLESLRDLSDLNRAVGRHAEAESLLRAVLVLREKQVGERNPELVRDIDALAWTCYAQGKLKDAAGHFARSLEILEQFRGPDDLALIPALLNLAKVLQPLNQDQETVALLERAVAIREKARGPEHPEVAADLTRLARHHAAQKRVEEAEKLHLRCLAIYEKANGTMHLSVTGPLDELSGIYVGQKRFEEAEPLLRRSLTIREWTNGPLHTELAPLLESLGGVLMELKRPAEAEDAYRRALALWEMKLGPDHSLLAATIDHTATACAAQHKYDAAESLFARALGIREKDSVANLNNLALVMGAQSKYADAEPYYKVALMILEKPPANPKPALKQPEDPKDLELLRATLENYSDLLVQMNRRVAAARLDTRVKLLLSRDLPGRDLPSRDRKGAVNPTAR